MNSNTKYILLGKDGEPYYINYARVGRTPEWGTLEIHTLSPFGRLRAEVHAVPGPYVRKVIASRQLAGDELYSVGFLVRENEAEAKETARELETAYAELLRQTENSKETGGRK